MELPNPRRPRLAPPRPGLVDDFFAPPIRPRSLAGQPAPRLLHPGSRLTGQPLLDTRPIGAPKLARPEFFIVELSDGRPGLVAVGDLTRVWVQPRYPYLPHHPHQSPPPTGPSWWAGFREAIRPKAGFILYAPNSVLPNAENPSHFLRQGYIYGAIDVGDLKAAMDMSGAKWESAATASGWFNLLVNYVLRFKDGQSGKGLWDAGVTVKDALAPPAPPKPVPERLMGQPRVKLIIYSGKKVSWEQITRDEQNFEKKYRGELGNSGDGHYYPQLRADGITIDSVYSSKRYDNHGKFVGTIVSTPDK